MESRNETEAEMTPSSDSNLKDLDYSCFFSTLRAIYGIPSFANWLKSHNGSCKQQTCVVCSMADLLHQTGSMSNEKSTESSSWVPGFSHYVCTKLEPICRGHSGHSYDPYAFLTCLLLSMEKSSKKSSNVSECFEEGAPSVEAMYGSLRSTFKCSTCQRITFMDEVLELNLHESCTINDCLIRHFAERSYQKCRTCNKTMQAKRKLFTTQLPVLCMRGTANGDINIPRQFSQDIDLRKFCSDDLTDIALKYRLVSMVIQSALGQYTAVLYSKDGTYLKCTEFNDQPITHNCMLDVSTFVLFYELKNNDSTVPFTSSFIDPHSTILSTEYSFGLNAAFVDYEMNEAMDDTMIETTDNSNTGTIEDSCGKSFNNTVASVFIETRSSGYNSGERSAKDNTANETTAQSTMSTNLVNESEKNVNFDDSTTRSTTVPPTIETNNNTSIIYLLDDSLNGSSPVLEKIPSELNYTNGISKADTSTVVPSANPQTMAKKGYKKLREADCTSLNLNRESKRYPQFGPSHTPRLNGLEVIELDSTAEENGHTEDPMHVNEQSDLRVFSLDSTTVENDHTEEPMNGNEGGGYKTFQIDSKLEVATIIHTLQKFGRFINELTVYPLSSHDLTTIIESVLKYCGITLKSLNLREEKNWTDAGIRFIFDNTFQNLENFECDYVKPVGYSGFFSRHTNLKKIVMKNSKNFKYLLSAISKHCKQLEELEIKISGRLDDEIADCLQSLEKLKKLTFYYPKKDMTKFTEQLRSLRSLEFLHLYNVYGSLAFVRSLSMLTSLHVLRLTDCYNLKNLNPLANLHQLTELIITGSDESAELDIVNLVNNLENLEWLDVNKRIDTETHNEIRQCKENLPATRTRPKIFIYRV